MPHVHTYWHQVELFWGWMSLNWEQWTLQPQTTGMFQASSKDVANLLIAYVMLETQYICRLENAQTQLQHVLL